MEDRVKTSFQGGYIENSNTDLRVFLLLVFPLSKKNARGVFASCSTGIIILYC